MSDDILNEVMNELVDDPNEEASEDVSTLQESLPTSETMQTEEIDVAVEAEDKGDEQARPPASRHKICEFPLAKIKGLMKIDPEVVMVGSEAVFVAAKASELFLQTLAKQAYKHTQAQKKKTVQRGHVDSAVTGSESLFFLEDALD